MLDTTSGIRVICTSTASLDVLQTCVVPDLLARLGGYRCALPPLRDRLGDFGALAVALQVAGELGSIAPQAAFALLRYRWPGNLRELQHVLRAARTVSGDGAIKAEHLPQDVRRGSIDDRHAVDVDRPS